MRFICCKTGEFDYTRTDIPESIGGPRTAACWFFEQLPQEQRERDDLTIHVSWYDERAVPQLEMYKKNERGIIVAL